MRVLVVAGPHVGTHFQVPSGRRFWEAINPTPGIMSMPFRPVIGISTTLTTTTYDITSFELKIPGESGSFVEYIATPSGHGNPCRAALEYLFNQAHANSTHSAASFVPPRLRGTDG